jgi:hypothetical protein
MCNACSTHGTDTKANAKLQTENLKSEFLGVEEIILLKLM